MTGMHMRMMWNRGRSGLVSLIASCLFLASGCATGGMYSCDGCGSPFYKPCTRHCYELDNFSWGECDTKDMILQVGDIAWFWD